MVVGFAVGKALSFIVTISQEGLLAFCTDKMLDMPMFAKGRNNSFLDWPPACSTDGYAHFVMAPETVELIEFIGSVAGSGPHLPGTGGQLLAAPGAVEVVRMVNLAPESQWFSVNN